jgi:hypothetical protein
MIGDGPLYTLEPTVLLDRWGDYGVILCDGLPLRGEGDEPLRLLRSGPFVPPISFPRTSNAVVVTNAVREGLIWAGVKGLGRFREVVLKKIVEIPWDEWCTTDPIPDELLPFGGEPENYLERATHSKAAANRVGALWTWHPDRVGDYSVDGGHRRLQGVATRDCDVFRLDSSWWQKIFLSDRGRSILEPLVGRWASFKLVDAVVAD